MVRMSRQELETIVEQQRPGFRIVDFDEDADAAADAAGPVADRAPDVTQYASAAVGAGGGEPARKPRRRKPKPRPADEPEDEIIVVARKDTGADPWSHGPGPKTIVVSGTTGRITAEQG